MPQFSRGGSPPPPGPRSPIIRLRANETAVIAVCSETWVSVVTHWDAKHPPRGRSMPCEGNPDLCVYCQAEINKRWRAYLHVICSRNGKHEEGFFELTQAAAEQIESDVGKDALLRGERFQVNRGAADNARLTLRRIASWSAATKAPLPEERSPELELMRLWGLVKRKLPKRNSA